MSDEIPGDEKPGDEKPGDEESSDRLLVNFPLKSSGVLDDAYQENKQEQDMFKRQQEREARQRGHQDAADAAAASMGFKPYNDEREERLRDLLAPRPGTIHRPHLDAADLGAPACDPSISRSCVIQGGKGRRTRRLRRRGGRKVHRRTRRLRRKGGRKVRRRTRRLRRKGGRKSRKN